MFVTQLWKKMLVILLFDKMPDEQQSDLEMYKKKGRKVLYMEKFCLYFFYYYILLIVIKEGLFKTRAILYTELVLNKNNKKQKSWEKT